MAKCNYSSAFSPIVLMCQKIKETTNDIDRIKGILDSAFNDAEDVYERFFTNKEPVSGQASLLDSTSQNTFIANTEDTISKSSELVETLFNGDNLDFTEACNNFKKEIVERTIMKINPNTYKVTLVDASKKNKQGNEAINDILTAYKQELIRKALPSSYLQELVDNDSIDAKVAEDLKNGNPLSEEAITFLMGKAIRQNLTGEVSKEMRNAIAFLKGFDSLIKEFCPFITISSAYDNEHGHNSKYQFTRAKAHSGNGWQNKEKAATEQVSDAAALILDYIPCVGENSSIIPDTSVGKSAFLHIAAVCRDFAMNNTNAKKEWDKGAKADISYILDRLLKEQNLPVRLNIKTVIPHIRGIQKFLFNAQLSNADQTLANKLTDLQNLFKKMFFNTALMTYVGYVEDADGNLRAKPLTALVVDEKLSELKRNMAVGIFIARENDLNWNISKGKTFTANTYNGVTYKKEGTDTYTISYDGDSWVVGQGVPSDKLVFKLADDLLFMSFSDEYLDSLGNEKANLVNYLTQAITKVAKLGVYKENFRDTVEINTSVSPNWVNKFKDTSKEWWGKLAAMMAKKDNSSVKSIVKSADGKSSLPAYSMMNLGHRLQEIADDLANALKNDYLKDEKIRIDAANKKLKAQGFKTTYTNPYNRSGFFLGDNREFSHVDVRSSIAIGDNTTTTSDLSPKDLLELSFKHDFLGNLMGTSSETFGLQTACFADKSMHFIAAFRKDGIFGKKLKDFITKKGDAETKNNIEEYIFNEKSARYQTILNNIILDYYLTYEALGEVEIANSFKECFNKKGADRVEALRQAIKATNKDYDAIQADFKRAGVADFKKELTYTKNGFNGLFYEMCRVYNGTKDSRHAFNERIKDKMKDSIVNAVKAGWMPPVTFTRGTTAIVVNAQNIDRILEDKTVSINYSPEIQAYFYANLYLAGEVNDTMLGIAAAHKGTKVNIDDLFNDHYAEYKEAVRKDESARTIAQIKRSVIAGATMHAVLQGLPNGVAPTVRIAEIADLQSLVQTVEGETKKQDSGDGSAFVFRPHGRLINNSLQDARAGVDRKTIGHGFNPLYGLPELMKFAEYDITNNRRQASYGSYVSLENLYKKMGSYKTFTEVSVNDITYEKIFDLICANNNVSEVYWKDNRTGEFIKLFKTDEGLATVVVDSNGNTLSSPALVDTTAPQTLYDIDQFFGGAWAMTMQNGELKYAETNVDAVEYTLSTWEATKDCYIGYAINTSALKVGNQNCNNVECWYNDERLSTFEMTTKYFGLQMDAEHEVEDDNEVSEMTQVISALIENGYSKDVVMEAYADIGKCALNAIKQFTDALDSDARDYELCIILGKALADAMEGKEQIGLAQAFVALANRRLKEGNKDARIPFSATTISNNLVSAISNEITKSAIKRKWSGFAGVQAPGYNFLTTYSVGGGKGLYRHYVEDCLKKLKANGFDNDRLKKGFDFFGATKVNIEGITTEEASALTDATGNTIVFTNELGGNYYTTTSTDEEGNLIETNTAFTLIPKPGIELPLAQTVKNLIGEEWPAALSWFMSTHNPYYHNVNAEEAIHFEDTYVVGNKAITIRTPEEYWEVRKAQKAGLLVIKNDATPANLRNPYVKFTTTTGREFNEWDLDVVRSMYERKRGFTGSEFGLYVNEGLELAPEYNNTYTTLINRIDTTKDAKEREALSKKIEMLENKLVSKVIQHQLTRGNQIVVDGVAYDAEKIITPGEIITGRVNTKALGIPANVDPNTITSAKVFENQLLANSTLPKINAPEEKEAWDLSSRLGNRQVLIKVTDNAVEYFAKKDNLDNLLISGVENPNYAFNNGNIYYHNEKILSGLPKNLNISFRTISTAEGDRDIFVIEGNKTEALPKLYDKLTIVDPLTRRNATEPSFKITAKEEASAYNAKVKNLANKKFESFKLLNDGIQARIPAQAMQSFQHIIRAAFTDSEVNELYINQKKQYADGSDYDKYQLL